MAVGLAVALVLVAHVALGVASMAVKSVTNDELAHLPAGLAAVATGELRLNPEHPPLVKLLAGLAAATQAPELPLEGAAYREANQWAFGRRVLFESGNDHRGLLFRGRLPVVGLSVLGCLGVLAWSRRRFGAGAGLFSLALYAFSPTVLAHGRLVTMDAAVAAGVVWTLYLWWRVLGRERSFGAGPGESGVSGESAVGEAGSGRGRGGRSWVGWVGCGAVLGLALAAKFSALLLLPAMALVEGVELAAGGRGAKERGTTAWDLGRRVARWTVVLATAVLVLQALYLFPADPLRYLRDLGHLYRENDPDALHYLAGEFRREGFPHYFLVALGVKTSLAALLAWAGGLAVAVRRAGRRAPGWRDDFHLWAPAVLWVAVHSAFAEDLGVRYMLPVYGLLAVLAGGIVPALGRLATPRRGRVVQAAPALALALALGQVSASWAAWPDYIPFFNRLAGGARGGPWWLHGANLDWGQDLGRLAPWLEARGIDRVRLLYFGAGVPEAYGVVREPMLPSDWWEGPRPGDYVISAQYLVRGLHQARETGAPTDWLRRYRPSGVLGGTLYLFRFPPPAAGEGQADEAQGAGG